MVIGPQVTLAHEASLLLRQINWLKENKTAKFLTLISFVSLLCGPGIWGLPQRFQRKSFFLSFFFSLSRNPIQTGGEWLLSPPR